MITQPNFTRSNPIMNSFYVIIALVMITVVCGHARSLFDVMKSVPMPLFRPPTDFYGALKAKNSQSLSFPITTAKRTKPKRVGRLQKELTCLLSDLPNNCKVESVSNNFRDWQLVLSGPRGSLFEHEQFLLRVKFPFEYPYKPPVMYFEKGYIPRSSSAIGSNNNNGSTLTKSANALIPVSIPKHPHIYSNGDICLSVLGRDWRPSMSTESIIASIMSLLSSAVSKRLPEDDRMHSEFNYPGQEQKNWQYHDTNV